MATKEVIVLNRVQNDGNSKDKLVLYAAGPDNLVNDMVKQFEKTNR